MISIIDMIFHNIMVLFHREELGILITAAVCHDLDHPGYNNT